MDNDFLLLGRMSHPPLLFRMDGDTNIDKHNVKTKEGTKRVHEQPSSDHFMDGMSTHIHRETTHSSVNIGGTPTPLQVVQVQSVAAPSDPTPKCEMLMTAGDEEMANWQNDLADYDYEVKRYHRRTRSTNQS